MVAAQDQELTTNNFQEKLFSGMYSHCAGYVVKKRKL